MEDTTDSLTMEQILQGLSKGTVLYKIKNMDTFYRKKYHIDMQTQRLKYSPSSKRILCNALPYVDLNEIEEIRKGWKSDFFCKVEAKHRRRLRFKISPNLRENCCFTIVMALTYETIDLLAPTTETRDVWFRGLTHLVANCKNAQREHQHERWLRKQFQMADLSKNGSLQFNECMALLHNMNIEMDKKHVENLFKEANFRKAKRDGQEALDLDEFLIFYRSIEARPELQDVFKQYSVNEAMVMGPVELCKFLKEEQKISTATVESCMNIIERFEKDKDKLSGFLSYRGFKEMMLSKDHDIFNKEHRAIYQDMSKPLSDYYIATSHNTYLTDGQLIGYSSIEGYIRVLRYGCRCVELDLWDGPEGEPVIYHGYTLTSKILLRDVLEAIEEYAFFSSQFPLILSLENHCSVAQQKVTANLIATILSNYLYIKPIQDDETKYPSPEELARKILIKAKKIKKQHVDEESDSDDNDQKLPEVQKPSEQQAIPRPNVTRHLSDLVNYCKATSFTTFQDVFETRLFYEMSSFDEVKADHLVETESDNFIRYNQKHLSRIYPKGTRTESSNMDPSTYWNVGCQMVALNCQTNDTGMLQHCGLFLANGLCGYVLKPHFLRNDVCSLSEIPSKTKKKTLILKIISGQHLPRPGQASEGEVIDPYVIVRVYGHPLDRQKNRTEYISNNGFNPKWNETMTFPIHVPELAIILIEVKDKSFTGANEQIAQFSVPFTSITEGYRHIHLWNEAFNELPLASLFVHVTLADD